MEQKRGVGLRGRAKLNAGVLGVCQVSCIIGCVMVGMSFQAGTGAPRAACTYTAAPAGPPPQILHRSVQVAKHGCSLFTQAASPQRAFVRRPKHQPLFHPVGRAGREHLAQHRACAPKPRQLGRRTHPSRPAGPLGVSVVRPPSSFSHACLLIHSAHAPHAQVLTPQTSTQRGFGHSSCSSGLASFPQTTRELRCPSPPASLRRCPRTSRAP